MSDAAPDEGSPPEGLGRTQTGKALALVIVAALLAVLVLHHTGPRAAARVAATGVTSPTTSVTVPLVSPPTTLAPLVSPAAITVDVLNGLQVGNLATNLTARLKADRYRMLPPDNTTVVTETSVIYVVHAGYLREAHVLLAALGLSAKGVEIRTVVPPTAPFPTVTAGADLVVVIGTSLQPEASTPPSTTAPATTVPAATTTSVRPTPTTAHPTSTTTRSTGTTAPPTSVATSTTTR